MLPPPRRQNRSSLSRWPASCTAASCSSVAAAPLVAGGAPGAGQGLEAGTEALRPLGVVRAAVVGLRRGVGVDDGLHEHLLSGGPGGAGRPTGVLGRGTGAEYRHYSGQVRT